MEPVEILIISFALVTIVLLTFIISCYKKCPSDKILVIYGKIAPNKDGTPRTAICIHGGAAFVFPIIQRFAFLDLNPITFEVDINRARSKDKQKVNLSFRYSIAISTEKDIMQNAAERLLGLAQSSIQEIATDIIIGQIRLVVASMDYEEIDSEYDRFFSESLNKVENELKKIGLRIVNFRLKDISVENSLI